jgi:hydroxyethylthiazole kinase-like uncharacterized protein yjeF
MRRRADQILTVAQMRAAEQALIGAGISVDALMQVAGRGAADYVWRLAAHRPVTVLCGPGNNGGDGYVIAEEIRQRGGPVRVIAATDPRTEAAANARALYAGPVGGPEADPRGDVLVDCLFGSGLTRPLDAADAALLAKLASQHRHAIAIDLPSGVRSDDGAILNEGLPSFDLTVALGAWKHAHFLMPASAAMGQLRLVGIGVAPVAAAAGVIGPPALLPPPSDLHKYRRGLVAVVAGSMPGAALLAARAAQGAGAGYVKLFARRALSAPPDIVVDLAPLQVQLADNRISALAIGSGLGRQTDSRSRLEMVIDTGIPLVLDADALVLLARRMFSKRATPIVATPHEGELQVLERAFGLSGSGSKVERARKLAGRTGMVIVAKGPDTVVAAPDGRIACAHRATSWLSTAGTGDVLAGIVAGRLASGSEPFLAACEAVWLHGEAARLCRPPFVASELAAAVPGAMAACL